MTTIISPAKILLERVSDGERKWFEGTSTMAHEIRQWAHGSEVKPIQRVAPRVKHQWAENNDE